VPYLVFDRSLVSLFVEILMLLSRSLLPKTCALVLATGRKSYGREGIKSFGFSEDGN
jgi:hypothetical protein